MNPCTLARNLWEAVAVIVDGLLALLYPAPAEVPTSPSVIDLDAVVAAL